MWLDAIFSGRECRPGISRGARYDKVVRYLAERRRAKQISPRVRNWMPYENNPRDLNVAI